jgi:hypothetical protein
VGDGSSGNPWSLTDAITNEAAGMRLNVLAGTYASTTTIRTLAAVGTVTAPIWWRGYKTTIGDQDANNVAVAGTDIPALTSTTGYFAVTGAHHILSNLDITSAAVTASKGTLTSSSNGLRAYGCRFANTAAAANGCPIFSTGAPSTFERCSFTATSSAFVLNCGSDHMFLGCTINGGTTGFPGGGNINCHFLFCVFANQGADCISTSTGYGMAVNCTFYSPGGNGILITGTPVKQWDIINCHFSDVNQAAKAGINITGSSPNMVRAINNSYFNCTANTAGFGDIPLPFDVGTLGSAGLTAPGSGDFSATTALKAIGFPGLFENTAVYRGYLDNGAVQRQEPASGGAVVITPFPGLGALLTI